MKSQNHTPTDVSPHFTILVNLKKFLCDFDDYKDIVILKMKGDLDRIDTYMGGGYIHHATKIVERVGIVIDI